MVKKQQRAPRRKESLSRDRIIEVAIELLDSNGEGGLTFRALSEHLATGAGTIYWHIANKSDLLIAACDTIIVKTAVSSVVGAAPGATIRAFALGLFDAMEAHPWVGSALSRASGQLPIVRIVECIGQQIQALGVPSDAQWAVVSALLSYILGVGGQNAANSQFAREQGLDRANVLGELSGAWADLDPSEFSFTRGIASSFREHDDREDFLAGIDLIVSGIELRWGD